MRKRFSFLPVVLIAALAITYLFSDWWGHLNTKVIDGYGDGYKAYHAILYHAKFDSTYSWYQGMNYPYGEQVVPGDSQPILSNGLRLLADLGWPLADQGWAIVHLSLLLGILLAALFTYLLLRRLGVGWGLATAASLLVTFLSPQVARLVGHFGLAHLEVLPATLYFLHRWEEKPSWQRSLPVALCVWVFSQIHFYFFAIMAFLIGGYLLARYLLTASWNRWWYYLWTLFLMFGLPAIYFTLWFYFTDPVLDRNEYPWGFFAYNSGPTGILTSHSQPHWLFLQQYSHFRFTEFEGRAYLGLVAALFFLLLPLRWLWKGWQQLPAKNFSHTLAQPILQVPSDARLFLQSLLFSAFGILLFSFGLPFTEVGGERWLEHLGPVRQFRSIGRFAWIFYFAVHLALWVEVQRFLEERKNAWKRPLVVCLLLAFTTFEVVNFWRIRDFRLDDVDGFNSPTLAERTKLDFTRYQAIIPLPYYNIGSDNFWLPQSGFTGQKVQTLSWQTGLSTTGAMLTRTSFDQTMRQLQLVSEPYRMPLLFDDLPNQQPFLLVYDADRYQDFGLRSNHLLAGAILRYKDDPLYLLELPLVSWKTRIQCAYAKADQLLADCPSSLADSLLNPNVLYVDFEDDASSFFVFEDTLAKGDRFVLDSLAVLPVEAVLPSTDACQVQSASKGEEQEVGSQLITQVGTACRGKGVSWRKTITSVSGADPASLTSAAYRGKGFMGDLGQPNTVVAIPEGLALAAGTYYLSFWIKIDEDRYPRIEFELQTRIGFQQAGPSVGSSLHQWVRVIDTNGWALVEYPFELTAKTTGIRLNLTYPLLKGSTFHLDDVLLRPQSAEVLARQGDTIYQNNRYRIFLPD